MKKFFHRIIFCRAPLRRGQPLSVSAPLRLTLFTAETPRPQSFFSILKFQAHLILIFILIPALAPGLDDDLCEFRHEHALPELFPHFFQS